MAGPLTSWSFSTLKNFQQCPKRVYYEKVLKEPQPELIIPDGKDEHPMLRGSRIHDSAEFYFTTEIELIPELESFRSCFEAAQELKNLEHIDIVVEEKWAYNQNWEVTGWNDADSWCRMKLDLLLIKDTEAILIDYKTGRRHGNEVSHMTQAQLYVLAAFIRYPELEHITVEFWYSDIGEITQAKYSRAFAVRLLPLFTSKGLTVTEEIQFNPKPSVFACKYCPYGETNGNSLCPDIYMTKKGFKK